MLYALAIELVFNGGLGVSFQHSPSPKAMEAMAHLVPWFTVLKNGWIFPWQTVRSVSHNQMSSTSGKAR